MMTRVMVCLAFVSAIAAAQGTPTPGSKTPVTKTQPPKADAKAPVTKQDTKTQVQAPVTKQDTKAQVPAPVTKQDTKATTTKTAPAPAPNTKAAAPQAAPAKPALTVAAENAPRPKIPQIMREVYDYQAAQRRDPFVSLLTTTDLRPTVADLRLVGVLFDETGRRPVAIMRDIATNTQYRVTTGMTLGRMRVASIRRRTVIFSIEEFGLNRQDSLMLGDTTKARVK